MALPESRPVGVIEQAIGQLRSAIMEGKFKPGQKLVEGSLCQTLGISRASMREALRALQAERLIDLIPNRGPFVAKLGPEEVEEIHDVWALMTGELVARFAEISTPADIEKLETSMKRLWAAVGDGNTLAQLAAINSFFNYISVRCGNRVFSEFVKHLASRINFLRAQSLALEGWPALCAQEISNVLAALRIKKAPTARAAMQRHIASACAAAKQVIVFRQAPASPRIKTDARKLRPTG